MTVGSPVKMRWVGMDAPGCGLVPRWGSRKNSGGMRADQMQLLHTCDQLQPEHQRVIRETAAAYLKLE